MLFELLHLLLVELLSRIISEHDSHFKINPHHSEVAQPTCCLADVSPTVVPKLFRGSVRVNPFPLFSLVDSPPLVMVAGDAPLDGGTHLKVMFDQT